MAAPASTDAVRRTGWIFHERFLWHSPGETSDTPAGLEPTQHFENPETKRRFNSLVHASGLAEQLVLLPPPKPASATELTRVHTAAHVERIATLSANKVAIVHNLGDAVSMSYGGYEIAALAAGGGLALVDAVMSGRIDNGYALLRPPGHHACRDKPMGFCIFNNVALSVAHALDVHGLERVAVIDWDVHHGNGTQEIFYEDPRALVISIHQDNNYPIGSGSLDQMGAGAGLGTNINVPLPPGCGHGAYVATFERVVVPALEAFKPQLILVSSGFDASFYDPLAQQMCHSDTYRVLTRLLMDVAARHAAGRLLCMHEGGYSASYVPFCGVAVLEELSGADSGVRDPMLASALVGYHDLQPWQDAVITAAEAGPLAALRKALESRC